MSGKEEYGIENICVALDEIEKQLKRLVAIEKILARSVSMTPTTISELDDI